MFYRESELAAGVYSMETVVHDAPSGKSSVRFATVEVPRYRGEHAADEQPGARQAAARRCRRRIAGPTIPLLVNGVALSSESRRRRSARPSKEVTFYFAIYPGKDGRGPDVIIELLQNGKPVSRCRCRCRRPTPTDGFSSSGACRSISSRPAPTSCAPSSNRATSRSAFDAAAHHRLRRPAMPHPPRRQLAVALLLATRDRHACGHSQPRQGPIRRTPRRRPPSSSTSSYATARGRPVTDLTADDFELFEDGVAQHVDTFTRVSRGGGIGVGVAWRSPADTTTVTTVEARGRGNAGRGVPDRGDRGARVRSSLHGIAAAGAAGNARLHAAVRRIRGARRRVRHRSRTPRPSGLHQRSRGRPRRRFHASCRQAPQTTREPNSGEELRARRRELETRNADRRIGCARSAARRWPAAAANIGGRETELRLVQTELNMLRSFQHLERDHRGYNIVLRPPRRRRVARRPCPAARRSCSFRKDSRCRRRCPRSSTPSSTRPIAPT